MLGRRFQLGDDTPGLSFESLEVVGFYSLIVPCFIGQDEALVHGSDHFIESFELIIVGVKRRHVSLYLFLCKRDARSHVNSTSVKKCLWCGRDNSDTESHCFECGTPWGSTSALDKPATSPTFSTDLLQVFIFSGVALIIVTVFLCIHDSDRLYRMEAEPFKWIVLGFLYSVGRVCFLIGRIVRRSRKDIPNVRT